MGKSEKVRRQIFQSVRLTPTEKNALDGLASMEGLTPSEVIRMALRESLKTRGVDSYSWVDFFAPSGLEDGQTN